VAENGDGDGEAPGAPTIFDLNGGDGHRLIGPAGR
jgi:hypothetical protein